MRTARNLWLLALSALAVNSASAKNLDASCVPEIIRNLVPVINPDRFQANWREVIAGFESKIALSSTASRRQAARRTLIVDDLIMGYGPHGAITARGISRTDPSRNVLVLSAGDEHSGVFAVGPAFRINSPGGTSNIFPTNVIKLRDLDGSKYAPAWVINDLKTADFAASEAHYLLNQWLTRINARRKGYEVATRESILIEPRNIILAAGFGTPKIPIKDPKLLEEFLREAGSISPKDPRPVAPLLQTVDDVLLRASYQAAAGLDPLAAYRDAEIVVIIGKGHGGMIDAEFFRGLAPKELYGRHPIQPKRVIWIGQPAKTPDEFRALFRAEFDADHWDRYDQLAEHIGNGVETIDGRFSGLARIKGDAVPDRYQITYQRSDGTTGTLVARYTTFATGYDSTLPSLMETLSPNVMLEPFYGTLASAPEVKTVIAKQVVEKSPDGRIVKAHSIWIVGPAAAPLATPVEVAASLTKNPVSINVLAERTEAIAKFVAEHGARNSVHVPRQILRRARLRDRPSDPPILRRLLSAPGSDFESSVFAAEVHLSRILNRFTLPGPTTLILVPHRDGAFALVSTDLSGPSLRRLQRAMAAELDLLQSLSNALENDFAGRIRLEIDVDSEGRVREITSLKE